MILARFPVFYFFAYGATGALFPIFPLMLAGRGMSPSDISLVMVVNPLVGLVAPPLWGLLADHFQIRERMIALLTSLCAATVMLLSLPTTLAGGVVAMFIFCIFRAPIATFSDAACYAALGSERSRFGAIRAFGSLGFAIFALAVAALKGSQHPVQLISFSASLYAVAAIISMRFNAAPSRERAVFRVAIEHIVRERLGLMFIANAIYYAAQSIFDVFFVLYVKEQGHGEGYAGLGWAIAVLAEVVLMFRVRRHLEQRDPSKLLVLCSFVAGFRWFALWLARDPLLILVLQLLHAFSFGLWFLALTTLVQSRVPEGVRTSVQGALMASMGAGTVIGVLAGGQLIERHGVALAFFASGVAAVVAGILYAIWRRGVLDSERRAAHAAPP